MRRVSHALTSGAALVAGSLAVWAAVSGFAVWGVLYLAQCVGFLLAPGSPFVLAYAAEGGEFELSAASYRIDLARRSLRVFRPALRDPSGSVVAQAGSVEFSLRRDVVVARADRLVADVVRERDGRLSLARAIPRGDPTQEAPPIDLTVDSGLVTVRDRSDDEDLQAAVEVRGVRLVQAGPLRWARAELRPPGAPWHRLELQTGAGDRLWVSWEAPDGPLDSIAPFALRWLDAQTRSRLEGFRSASLRGGGQIEFASSPAGIDVSGRFEASAERAALGSLVSDARARFGWAGSLEEGRVSLEVVEAYRSVLFEGAVGGRQPVWASGRLSVASRDRRSLWPAVRDALPRELDWAGARLEGPATLVAERLDWDARVRARSVGWQNERLSGVEGDLAIAGGDVAFRLRSASWRGQPVSGALSYRSKLSYMNVALRSSRFDLAALDLPAEGFRLGGSAELRALIEGPVDRLRARFWADGTGSISAAGLDALRFDQFEAWVSGEGGRFRVDRFGAFSSDGVLVGSGSFSLDQQELDLSFDLGSVRLARFVPGLSGVAAGQGTIRGPLANPAVVATVEAYGLEAGDVSLPFAETRVRFSEGVLAVEGARAWVGGGLVFGQGALRLEGGAIEGEVSGNSISLAALFGPETSGLASVDRALVAGTLDSPVVRGVVRTGRVIVPGAECDEVELPVEFDGRSVRIVDGGLRAGLGRARVDASYDVESGVAALDVGLEDFPASALQTSPAGASLGGTVSGKGRIRLEQGELASADATLRIAGLAVNDAPVGNGEISLASVGGELVGSAVVGSLERYIEVADFRYDLRAQRGKAEFFVHDVPLEEVVGSPSVRSALSAADWRGRLDGLGGKVSGSGVLMFEPGRLAGEAVEVDVAALALGGRGLGSLKATGDVNGDRIDVRGLEWTGPAGSLTARGFIDADRSWALEADLTNFDTTLFAVLIPEAPVVSGRASATARLEGSLDRPVGRASVFARVESLVSSSGESTRLPLTLDLGEVALESDRVTAVGSAFFEGFAGRVTVDVPFSALDAGLPLASRAPLVAEAVFDRRPLSAFAAYLPALEAEGSDGHIDATLRVTGLAAELNVEGMAALTASRLSFAGIQTQVANVEASAALRSGKATVAARAGDGRGGVVEGRVEIGPIDLNVLFGDLEVALERLTVRGQVSADSFRVEGTLPGAEVASEGRVTGQAAATGRALAPILTGGVRLDAGVLAMPAVAATGTPPRPVVDPEFQGLRLGIGESRLLTGFGDLRLSGDGTLDGPFSSPTLLMPLALVGGEFLLPNARIKLEPGGEIVVNYQSFGAAAAGLRVDVALEGETRVVSRRSTGEFESYAVSLSIDGNLLDAENLRLSASSDPPDLGSDEILAIIGQRDLVAGLAQFAFGDRKDRDFLRQTIYQAALPALSQGLTRSLAEGLGLDFLALDYDPFSEFVLSGGKTLGRGLLLQGRRQVAEVAGRRRRFEVKLAYRPPTSARLFSRVRFGVAVTESVPWRLSIDWARRF